MQQIRDRIVRSAKTPKVLSLVLASLSASVLLIACDNRATPAAGSGPTLPTAASLGEQSIQAVAEYLAAAPYSTANEDLGNRLLSQCRACHTFAEGTGHTLGPNLYDIFGRRAGSAKGYRYTKALQDAAFVWTPRALDAWLAQPQQFLPGNAMAYGGLRFADDRAALIASLMRQTADLTAPMSNKIENDGNQ